MVDANMLIYTQITIHCKDDGWHLHVTGSMQTYVHKMLTQLQQTDKTIGHNFDQYRRIGGNHYKTRLLRSTRWPCTWWIPAQVRSCRPQKDVQLCLQLWHLLACVRPHPSLSCWLHMREAAAPQGHVHRRLLTGGGTPEHVGQMATRGTNSVSTPVALGGNGTLVSWPYKG